MDTHSDTTSHDHGTHPQSDDSRALLIVTGLSLAGFVAELVMARLSIGQTY